MNTKIIFAVLSVAIGIYAFYPYFKNIISGKVRPHIFTWLIWAITQGTAVAGMWVGGGGIGSIGLTIGTLCVLIIFFISLKNGKKDVTTSDITVLTIAILAILIWWIQKDPLVSVFMVSAIDVVGYIPTFRKSHKFPYSETALTWTAFIVANIFAILALQEYNLITMTYLVSITAANTLLVLFLIFRRKCVNKKF